MSIIGQKKLHLEEAQIWVVQYVSVRKERVVIYHRGHDRTWYDLYQLLSTFEEKCLSLSILITNEASMRLATNHNFDISTWFIFSFLLFSFFLNTLALRTSWNLNNHNMNKSYLHILEKDGSSSCWSHDGKWARSDRLTHIQDSIQKR